MSSYSSFHPGATRPIMTSYTEPPDTDTTGWTATFTVRRRDSAPVVLELTGDITVETKADLPADVAEQFPALADDDDVWVVTVTPDTSDDTQDLRGTYAAGLDLTSTDENVPLLDHHRITFSEDISS